MFTQNLSRLLKLCWSSKTALFWGKKTVLGLDAWNFSHIWYVWHCGRFPYAPSTLVKGPNFFSPISNACLNLLKSLWPNLQNSWFISHSASKVALFLLTPNPCFGELWSGGAFIHWVYWTRSGGAASCMKCSTEISIGREGRSQNTP